MEAEQGISFTEFTYQLLQGYDFVHLCREHGVRVQVSWAARRGGGCLRRESSSGLKA
jgi:tyrosyl-tRNA synthetase